MSSVLIRHPLRAALPLVTLTLLAGPASAQDITGRIDGIFARFASADGPGCVVGVAQNGTPVAIRAYGLADVQRRMPMTTAMKFDIGSVQKQFVAAAVLLLVEDGRLTLSDDIRTVFPELPEYGHTIRVDHLLTHTSGIRDWTALLPLAPEGSDVLKLIFQQRGLNFAPGQEWSYSNSGYVLLKELVARVSGMSFAEFAQRRLFEPLGMPSTAYVADILQGEGPLALAYQQDGSSWKQHMRLGNERGGGAIISTAGDLLLWNAALTSGRLGRFVTAKLHEPARLNNGRALTYTRGLTVTDIPGGPLISHSGGAAGYGTWLGRFTDHGLSIATMCNFEPVSVTQLSGRVADLFLAPVDGPRPPGPVAAAGVSVAERAGLYFEEGTGLPLRLLVNNGRLAIANGPPLVPVSAERFQPPRASLFLRSEDAFTLVFLSHDELDLVSMEGQATRYRRAEPWTPSAAELEAVAGRYSSSELGSEFEIVPSSGGITMRIGGSPERAVELEPVAPDTYMRSLMIVRFRRDSTGRVTGLEYGNPVVRRLELTRVGDRSAGAP
ncbi:MAG: serine hydrolase [Thioalkalivibrio sp.]|nr:serine hydrolase [Thioalkalivibrio sp.]